MHRFGLFGDHGGGCVCRCAGRCGGYLRRRVGGRAAECRAVQTDGSGTTDRIGFVPRFRQGNSTTSFFQPAVCEQQKYGGLADEYRAEPHIALAGGEDGMDLVRTIVAQAKNYPKPNGILVVEIGNEYEHAMRAFSHLPLTWLDISGSEDGCFC